MSRKLLLALAPITAAVTLVTAGLVLVRAAGGG